MKRFTAIFTFVLSLALGTTLFKPVQAQVPPPPTGGVAPQPVPAQPPVTPAPVVPTPAPAVPSAMPTPAGPAGAPGPSPNLAPPVTPTTPAATTVTGAPVSEVVTVTSSTQRELPPAKSVYAKPFRKLFAVVKTDLGSFRIALQTTQKPVTVENFVRLAEGSKGVKDLKTGRITHRPFYDGLTFHRAIRGTLIQSGCPYGDGRGGPGHTIQDEGNDFDTVEEGSVLMARASSKAKNSAGSQFYIMLRPLPDLTDQDTIFGKVVDGLDVVRKISEVKVDRIDRPINAIKIQTITIQKE